jgi:hypothetical protein
MKKIVVKKHIDYKVYMGEIHINSALDKRDLILKSHSTLSLSLEKFLGESTSKH